MAQVPPLPLETARRIARAALSSLEVTLRVDEDAVQPTFSWVYVALPAQQFANHNGVRNVRESLRVLTALAACNGFSLSENPKFWSEIWPQDPEYERLQPHWAVKWKHLHLRGRPVPSDGELKFLFPLEGTYVAGRARNETIAAMEELLLVRESQETESAGFRLTIDILSRHIQQDKWPLSVLCGVESLCGDGNRWNRLYGAVESREKDRMTKMWMPFQLTGCMLSAKECLRNSGALKDVATVFQMRAAVPVKEMKLEFGWNAPEKSWKKRLARFRQLLWNVVNASEVPGGLRVLHLTGRCITDTSYFSALFSALPYIEGLQELRLEVRPIVQHDTRKLFWHWLALTVFHPQSNVSIQHLDLSQCDVSVGDVGVVIDVMDNEWNSAMLLLLNYEYDLNFSAPTGGALSTAVVQANTRVEVEPVHRLFSKPLVVLKRQEQFIVLSSSSEWVCVYVPGLGRGFIQRQSVVSTSRHPTFPSSQNSGVKSLTLKTTKIWPTLALLQKIGGHLERLNLECEAFTNLHLKVLIDSCPRLTHLTLRSTQLDDFSSFVDASAAGVCKFTTLHLLTRTITPSCVDHFVKVFSNPVWASKSCFRELQLQTGFLKRSDLNGLLRLLQENRSLRCLRVKIAFDLFDEFMPRFLAHRGDWLRGGQETKQKLAFLSVISATGVDGGVMQNIDATMLSRIFAYTFEGERFISLDEYTDMLTIQDIARRANAA